MGSKADTKVLLNGTNNPDYETIHEFPRMLYRKAEDEERQVQTHKDDGSPKTWIVTNSYDGRLCDTRVVHSLDEAETASADGWELSPAAAYGEVTGIAAAASAKDERIAELEAALAVAQIAPERRGPGRPPRLPVEA